MLALADIAAEAKRLAERQPILGDEAVLDHRTPEDKHIDSEYWRRVAAFLGMVSEAFAWAVPHGWTQGTRPASSSAIILSVIS